MRFIRPHEISAGYWVDGPLPDLPEMRQFGEHWVPQSFETGLHQHWHWDVHYQEKGCTHWKHPDGVSQMNTGEACLVAPGVEHGSRAHTEGAQHFYFIEVDFRPWLTIEEERLQQPPFRILPHASRLQPLFRQIIQEGSQTTPHQTQALRHLLGLLTIEIERLVTLPETKSPDTALPLHAHPAVLKAKDLIDRKPEQAWRLDQLAYMVGLSPNHLTSTFHQTFDQTPIQYLHRKRIAKAKELLARPDFSLSEIALELGYASGQHFSTRFKRETGTTPARYRKQQLPLRTERKAILD